MTALVATTQSRMCPLCGPAGTPALVSEAKIDESQLTSLAFASRKPPEYMHHRLVRCSACDLVYADPSPDPQTLAAAYRAAAFDSGGVARLASRTYGRLVDALLPRLPGRSGALDIGTGDGSFLLELLARGFSGVRGIEPSEAPIAAASSEVRSLIRLGTFQRGLVPPRSLSLVTCFQTIEHLHDPLATCREAADLLRPGGALLLVGHNRCALSARVLGERSPIYDIEHLQLFSAASAKTLLSRSGLTDISVRPLINRYPVTYWLRLLPLPEGMKRGTIAGLAGHSIGHVSIPLPAGNMWMVGFRPR